MKDVIVRDARPADFAAICALNEAEIEHTSAMDVARLAELASIACVHWVACVEGSVAAFILAMCNGALYQNENFAWFSRKFPRFVYIDRVVVSPACRGLGVGRLLYERVFGFAAVRDIPAVTCEYNIVPRNAASAEFHDRLGFRELGTQWVAEGKKQVSLQALEIRSRMP
jgi:predicted GNAT superfamily acetyltransferase